MLKSITISFLIFIVSVQTFDQFGVFIEYQLNKEFIQEVLCINKDKPDLDCQGYCYVSEKIKKQHQDTSTTTREFKQAQHYFEQIKLEIPKPKLEFIVRVQNPKDHQFLDQLFSFDIFHPPTFL